MDKRKQFQLQILNNKLVEYTSKLETLKSKQRELSITIQNSSGNNNILIPLENKKNLEARIQQYKTQLDNHRTEYTRLNHQLKLLPGQLESNKAQELAIYEEEIQNITGRKQEAYLEHLETLASLEIEKNNLSMQILDLQSQLSMAQDNISSIQENAHTFRKNTILELQQKKQQKLIINTTLEELNKNKELYTTNSSEASTRLENLITLKTDIINMYYANPENILQIPNTRELLPTEFIDTNTSQPINNTELFNAIISYLDKQILETRYIISSISKKADRLDKTITATSNELKIKLEPTSREKVISYKNNYKNAKLAKTSLEEELQRLQARFNSWEQEVVENVKLEYKMQVDSLEAEHQRASERLNIMTSRITSEYESNTISLANAIKQIENEITKTNNLLKQTNLELTTLLEDIARNNSTQLELDKINTQIANVELAIEKIQQDINSLTTN